MQGKPPLVAVGLSVRPGVVCLVSEMKDCWTVGNDNFDGNSNLIGKGLVLMQLFSTWWHLRVCMLFAYCWSLALLGGSHAQSVQNQLTRAEEVSGWELLFDGRSPEQFRNYKQESLSDGWVVEDGALVRQSSGPGDIITKDSFRYFELSIEYRIAPG